MTQFAFTVIMTQFAFTVIMTQFTFLQLFDETLSRYDQIDESCFSINVSTDSCVETLIPENDDFLPKCDTLSIGTQTTKKVQEKKEYNIKMLP